MAAAALLAALLATPVAADETEKRPRGSLSKELVRRTIYRGMGPIRTCFE